MSWGEGWHSPHIVLNIYAEMAINFVINSFIKSKAEWKTKKFKLVLTVGGFLLCLFKGEAEIWNTVIRKASFLFFAKKRPYVLDFRAFLCMVLFKVSQRTDVTVPDKDCVVFPLLTVLRCTAWDHGHITLALPEPEVSNCWLFSPD